MATQIGTMCDLLRANPGASNEELHAGLTKAGITIEAKNVPMVKYQAKQKLGKGTSKGETRGRRRGRKPAAAPAAATTGIGATLDLIGQLKAIKAQAGSDFDKLLGAV